MVNIVRHDNDFVSGAEVLSQPVADGLHWFIGTKTVVPRRVALPRLFEDRHCGLDREGKGREGILQCENKNTFNQGVAEISHEKRRGFNGECVCTRRTNRCEDEDGRNDVHVGVFRALNGLVRETVQDGRV